MKKSYIVSVLLILIVLAFYSSMPTTVNQKLITDEKYNDSPESKNKSTFESQSDEITHYVQQATTEIQTTSDINELTIDLVEPVSYIDIDSKALKSDTLEKKLNVEIFQTFLDEISTQKSDLELDREYEVTEILNEKIDLNLYQYTSECGSGICAVEVKYVPNNESNEIAEKLFNILNFGALTYIVRDDKDGTNSIRIIFAADSSISSITYTPQ